MATFKNLIFHMAYFKNLFTTSIAIPRTFLCPLSQSRTQLVAISFAFLSVLFFTTSLISPSSSFRVSSLASRLFSQFYISPFSSITSPDTCLVSDVSDNCTLSTVTAMDKSHRNSRKEDPDSMSGLSSCNIFDGHWILDHSSPLYPPGSCPFIDESFNCIKNGRTDLGYTRYRWKPHGCELPRFDGRKMLKMLRGKRLVFVGDSLNRNMWQSLVCALRHSLKDKSRIFEASGRREFKTQGFYSVKFNGYKSSIDFIKSPFLVQEWRIADKNGTQRETLRLDRIHNTSSKYNDADILIFNTGHWWTHQKTCKGKDYFQEGKRVYGKLGVNKAYKKALLTWAKWIDSNINSSHTRVYFRGYSASHYRRGKWNSGGRCDREKHPVKNETQLGQYPWMMNMLESVISEMKTPVLYLNITRMTDFRKDAHPSVYRPANVDRSAGMIQDCSHWCLPGVPDYWNQLLYATLLLSQHDVPTNGYQ